jgi:hypothetical protein
LEFSVVGAVLGPHLILAHLLVVLELSLEDLIFALVEFADPIHHPVLEVALVGTAVRPLEHALSLL